MADMKSLAVDAIDAWFTDKIKSLSEVHHQSIIGGTPNSPETSKGIRLACRTREEMRALANSSSDPAV